MRAGHIKIMRGIAESTSGVQCRLIGIHSSLKHQSGAALVIVLSFLVLITIMVVAFFSSTATEAVAAKTETHLQTTRQLADSTTQYVISQIRQATSGGTTRAWASQPGMIRTWNDAGRPDQAFKLYSALQMRQPVVGSYSPASDMPASTWEDDKALWTDLNAPILSGNNTVFPILDPRAAATVTGNNSLVEGFSYDASALSGARTPTSTSDASARAPMPVRWIYVLKDGRFSTPSIGNGTVADFANSAPQPTANNPIVGRVAFWTDDETCKLNLNTAVGGVPWDIPTYTAGIDLHFSRYKPVKDEFARYPGHPATTSLLPVFWSFGGLTSPNHSLFPTLSPPFPYQYSASAYTQAAVQSADVNPTLSSSGTNFFTKALALNPRNMWGGSAMGSRATVVDLNSTIPAQPIDSDRLFASVDEALFGQPTTSSTTRPANAFGLNNQDVEKLRFFLTTQSRAPDINPLNQPKVGIWPIPQTATNRTPTDRLLAFCSTLNGNAYYFTRNNPDSPTADFSLGSRNDQLFDYLERSMGTAIPGFGGNLQNRYTTVGLRRILTLAYDYIRGSVNLVDTFGYTGTGTPSYSFTDHNKAQVVPIKITKGGADYKGLGRFVTIKQAGLHFIAVAANQPPCIVDPATGIPSTTINPMHPWVGNPPAAVATVNNGDGTWNITAVNSYPNITGQTHAGLPYLSDKWISDPNVLTGTTPPDVALRATAINPRYQGPAAIYGPGAAPGAINSQALPAPWPTISPGRLGPHQTVIQALFFIDPVIVNPGNPPYSGRYQARVTGLDGFTVNGQSLYVAPQAVQLASDYADFNKSRDFGVGYGMISGHFRSSAMAAPARRRLQFQSQRVVVGPGADQGSTFLFGGGNITVEIRSDTGDPAVLGDLIQTFQINFPNEPFPTPLLPPMPIQGAGSLLVDAITTPVTYAGGRPTAVAALTPSTLLTFDINDDLAKNPNFGVGASIYRTDRSRYAYGSGAGGDLWDINFILPERLTDPAIDERAKLTSDTVRSIELLYGDARVAGAQPVVGSNFFTPHIFYNNVSMRSAHTLRVGDGFGNLRGATDHMLSASSVGNPSFKYTQDGAGLNNYRGFPLGSVASIRNIGAIIGSAGPSTQFIQSAFPHVTSSVDFNNNPFLNVWSSGGDYDTGQGLTLDGPFINKPNEGGEMIRNAVLNVTGFDGRNTNPDFNYETFEFSIENLQNAPNRQIPSPVVFGSLPVGNTPQTSWRTLLFSPNPNSPNHLSLSEMPSAGNSPATGTAPDYLFLDYFNMPVVEPYAISEPFSTAGRVNMNYQIAPFTYIRRDTALRGVLRSNLLTAAEDSRVQNRKMSSGVYHDGNAGPYTQFLQNTGQWAFRYPIHVNETLKQFEQRFNNGDIFRAPSEICSLWLYPGRQPTALAPENPGIALVNWDANSAGINAWWYGNLGTTSKSVTGDNMRERPYATIYPRLTTKSNTYTLHYRVQTLSKIPGGAAAIWDETRDRVVSEYRGSAMIERYVDPSDPQIPDFASAANAGVALDAFYRYRVLNTKRFAP
jgi:uncharacterized protein (TIGR02600 family)